MKHFVLLTLLSWVGFACATTPKQTTWIPFELKQDQIIVPIRVQHVETQALIDTGANVTVIDNKLADKLNIRNRDRDFVRTMADNQYVEFGHNVHFNFYGADIYLDVAIKDLSDSNFQVIFGSSLLRGAVTEFDFPHRQMRFHRLGAYAYAGPTKPIPLHEISGVYHVDLNINGETQRLLVDTGASLSLALPLSSQKLEEKLKKGAKQGRLVGGSKEVAVTADEAAASFALGDYQIHKAGIQYYDPRNGVRTDGVVGMGILKEFTVIFDTDHDAMYVEAYE